MKEELTELAPSGAIGVACAVQEPRPRIGFVSLGCPKNLVDSEVMMGLLDRAGAEITNRPETADILVVNTCSFIDKAKQESIDTILQMAEHKVSGKARKLIVAGCLVERYRDEIRKNMPEVDAVVGTGELEAILATSGLVQQAHHDLAVNQIFRAAQAHKTNTRPRLQHRIRNTVCGQWHFYC